MKKIIGWVSGRKPACTNCRKSVPRGHVYCGHCGHDAIDPGVPLHSGAIAVRLGFLVVGGGLLTWLFFKGLGWALDSLWRWGVNYFVSHLLWIVIVGFILTALATKLGIFGCLAALFNAPFTLAAAGVNRLVSEWAKKIKGDKKKSSKKKDDDDDDDKKKDDDDD